MKTIALEFMTKDGDLILVKTNLGIIRTTIVLNSLHEDVKTFTEVDDTELHDSDYKYVFIENE